MPSDVLELTLEEMLADPIVGLMMRADGICAEEVRAVMEEAGRRLDGSRPLRR